MTRKRMITALGLALAMAGCAAGPARPGEASIPYAGSGDIADHYAANDSQLYLMDRTGRWYLATMAAPCYRLSLQNTIGFRTSATGLFDATSSIVTADGVCSIASLVRTDRPAAKGGKGRNLTR